MLKAEQIPDEVVRALWEVTGEEPVGVLACLSDAKTYLAAAINAWPDLRIERLWALPVPTDGIILPLPQEEKFQPYTCTRCLGATENADDLCDDCAKEPRDE